jgi:Uri superfamily endonuclease
MESVMQNTRSAPFSTSGRHGFKIKNGTYVLIFELRSSFRLSVGRLGLFNFPAGWYAYTGSALGPGGLPARIRHHLGIATRPHWHMDYLRPRGYMREVWYGRGPYYDEHRWAACLRSMPRTVAVVPGFGSSDCRCETHLVYFSARPGINPFKRRQKSTAGAVRPPIYSLPVDALNAMIK